MTIQVRAEQAVRSVCPIYGISFGNLTDKATWRIDFKEYATTEQRDAAQAAIDAFDPNAPEAPPATTDEVDAINRRLRARELEELAAEIAKLPADQQEVFRRIQRLLPETP